MHPRYPFDQTLERIEFLGLKKKAVKTHVNKIRMGLISAEDETQDGQIAEPEFEDGPSDDEMDRVPKENTNMLFRNNSAPAPDNAEEFPDEDDFLMMNTNNPAPNNADEFPDEEDFLTTVKTTNPSPNNADEFPDEEDLLTTPTATTTNPAPNNADQFPDEDNFLKTTTLDATNNADQQCPDEVLTTINKTDTHSDNEGFIVPNNPPSNNADQFSDNADIPMTSIPTPNQEDEFPDDNADILMMDM